MAQTARLNVTAVSFSLFRDIEDMVAAIDSIEYIVPDIVGVPRGCTLLGDATEAMKQLYTLWRKLEEKGELGVNELFKRAAHTAISYEIGKHFDRFGLNQIGINSEWKVYAFLK